MTEKDSVDLGRWMNKHGVPSRIWVRGNRNSKTVHEIQSSIKKPTWQKGISANVLALNFIFSGYIISCT